MVVWRLIVGVEPEINIDIYSPEVANSTASKGEDGYGETC